jgi:Fic family protein
VTIFDDIAAKKAALDAARPLPPEVVRNLADWFDVELTYTSNAIEGNTLTRSETALVLEKGLTIGGKPLKDHIEAVNHLNALHLVRAIAEERAPITERRILDIHALVLRSIDDRNAGAYRSVPVRIAGSRTVLPAPVKVPASMAEFGRWIGHAAPTPENAFAAHYRLVSIHPFIDGNGRTARLLMNLLLFRGGYPPAVVPPERRGEYIDALERGQTTGDEAPFNEFMATQLVSGLDAYLDAVRQLPPIS